MKLLNFFLSGTFLIVAGVCSCSKNVENGIMINFINSTGEKIKAAKADNKLIGDISVNGNTGYIHFDSFGTDTGSPDCEFTGELTGKLIESTSKFYWCGTEKSKLQPGKYNIEIKIAQDSSNRYFDLHFK